MNLNDIYKTVPVHQPTGNEPLLSEDDVRQRMSDISRRTQSERATLRNAYVALTKREFKAQLAIKFLQPHLLFNKDAKEYVEKAIADKVKLTVGDIEAVLTLELEREKVAYDLAKFDCDTSDKDFNKLEPQLSFYQTLLKMT